MKRRSFLELLGFTAVGGSVAAFAPNDPPDWDNDIVSYSGYDPLNGNGEIIKEALRFRSSEFADVMSNNNALLDHLRGNARTLTINHDPSPFWKTNG
jgi:hypothetical protein